jgi:hypothetical protein
MNPFEGERLDRDEEVTTSGGNFNHVTSKR